MRRFAGGVILVNALAGCALLIGVPDSDEYEFIDDRRDGGVAVTFEAGPPREPSKDAAGPDQTVAPATGYFAQLVGYWSFDGNANDESGHGLDLVVSGATFTEGRVGGAIAFANKPGATASRAGSDPALDFGAEDFSIQAWVELADTGKEQTLFEKFFGASGPGWTVTRLAPGQLQFYGSTFQINSASPLSLGAWHHIMIVRQGGSLTMRIDDVVAASIMAPPAITAGRDFIVGGRNTADNRFFPTNGRIDELAIWRRALTAAEVTALYNQGKGLALSR